jgi:hypothetical protein
VSLIALCSLKGSPGVTTTAVALAGRWPDGGRPVLVECDPAGGDLLARFRLPPAPGLVSLAAAARRGAGPRLLWQHAQTLPGGLSAAAGPVGAGQACAALGEIAGRGVPVLRRPADEPGSAVVADCGRVGPASPALAVLRAADVVLVLARPRDDQLAHLAADLHLVEAWSGRRCLLLLVGDGHATRAVAAALGAVVLGRLPHDPAGAELACGRRRSRTGPGRTRLGRAAARLAATVAVHTPPVGRRAVEATTPTAGCPPPPSLPASLPDRPSPRPVESRAREGR